MMEGAEGRYVVCERRRPELLSGVIEKALTRWAVTPLAAFEDASRAQTVMDTLEADEEGGVFGVLDSETNQWIVYPKPRGLLYRFRRRHFRRG